MTVTLDSPVVYVEPNPEVGGFLDPLDLRWVGGDRPYLVKNEYRYSSLLVDEVITVAPGYHTDFASVPWFLRQILPKNGPYTPAAVIHDWLCDRQGRDGIDSAMAHRIFLEAMETLRVPLWKRALMYRGVKWFGPRFKSRQISRPQ